MRRWMERIKPVKREQILILLLCGVLLLVITIPGGEKEAEYSRAERQDTSGADVDTAWQNAVPAEADIRVRQMEQRLEEILGKVEGIGRVEVMLTLKSGGRKILEKDVEQTQGKEESQGEGTAAVSDQAGSSEATVFQRDSQGNEAPYVTEELEPEVAGVLVTAQGAKDARIVGEITDAVMALFGVEAHKIKVMKME